MENKYICKVCGASTKHKDNLCKRHYQQIKEFGFPLDYNSRNYKDGNEITIHEDYAEIQLYDDYFNELEQTVLIDLKDVGKIKDVYWKKSRSCIIGKYQGETILLSNFILETNERVEFINNDWLDCRKDNLNIIEKKKKRNKPIVSKKNRNKIILQSLGESHEGVTGSSWLVSYPTKEGNYENILIELGMCQKNGDLKSEYVTNRKIVDRIPSEELVACLISHAHTDHTGLLPSLINKGVSKDFRYIMTSENKELLKPLLLDGAYILSRNCQVLTTKKYKAEPFYTDSDVFLMLNKTDTYEKNVIHKLNDYVSFRFVDNSHILGATSIELFIKTPSGSVKKIYYSGDVGSNYNKQPFCCENQLVPKSTATIIEATYSDITRNFTKNDVIAEREQMRKDILNEIKNRRSILIPAFAMSRTQNLLCYLYDNFKDDKEFGDTPIYLDGKLSLEMNNTYQHILKNEEKEYFKNVLNWSNIHYVKDFQTSQTIALKRDETKIILSSNGMVTVGRILNHVKANVENSKYTIMVVGYCAEGTIGNQLLSNQKTIKIEGMVYNKRCKVVRYKTWSSHAQGQELINIMSQLNTELIIIHHSDIDTKVKFRDYAEEQLRSKNKSTRVTCADDNNNIFYI